MIISDAVGERAFFHSWLSVNNIIHTVVGGFFMKFVEGWNVEKMTDYNTEGHGQG